MSTEQTDAYGSTGSVLRLFIVWSVVSVAALASVVVAFVLRDSDSEMMGSVEEKSEDTVVRLMPEESESARVETLEGSTELVHDTEPQSSNEEDFGMHVPSDTASRAIVSPLDEVIIHTQSALVTALQNRPNLEVVSHLQQAQRSVRMRSRHSDIGVAIDQAVQTIQSIKEPPRLEIQRRLDVLGSELVSRLTRRSVEMQTTPSQVGESEMQANTLWDELTNTLGEIYRIRRLENTQSTFAIEMNIRDHLALLSAIDRMKHASVVRDKTGYAIHARTAIDLAGQLTASEPEVEQYVKELESMLEIDFMADVESIERVLLLLDSNASKVSYTLETEQ